MQQLQNQLYMLQSVSDSVIAVDVNGIITYWNNGAERIFGEMAKDWLGKPMHTWSEGFNIEDFVVKKDFDVSKPIVIDWEYIRKDGRHVYVKVSLSPIINENGEVIGVLGVSKDITERKLTELELKESNLKLDSAVEGANLGLWDYNVADGVNVVNERWCSMLGFDKGEVEERIDFLKSLLHNEEKELFEQALHNLHSDGLRTIDIAIRMRNKAGGYQWINIKAKAITFKDDGSPLRIIGTIQDITKQVEITNLLKATNAIAEVGGWQFNPLTGESSSTSRVAEIFAVDNPSKIRLGGFEYFHAEDKKLLEAKFHHLMKTGEGYDIEARLTDAQGIGKWVRSIVKAEVIDGKVVNIIGALQDITKIKRSEELLSITSELANVGGWEYDLVTKETVCTEQVYKIYGLPNDTVITPEFGIKFYHPEDLHLIVEVYEKLVTEGEPYDIQVRFIDANGNLKWVRAIGECDMVDGKVVRVFGSFQDVTKQVMAEKTIAQSLKATENIRHALDVSTIVAITDIKGVILQVNDRFVEISGYTRAELIGQTHKLVNSRHHKQAFFIDMWSTISKGRVWKGEIKNKAKNGSYYWVDTTIVPQLDEDGKPYQYIAVRHEITGRRKAEEKLKDLNKNLEQKVKDRTVALEASNEDLKAFNYMLSHDLRTPLRAIGMFATQMQRKLEKEGEINEYSEYLEYINSGIKEMERLIADILEYTKLRKSKTHPSEIDLSQRVKHCFAENSLLHPFLNAELVIDEPINLTVDNVLFSHIVINLIGNSFKYAKAERQLVIEVQLKEEGNYQLLTFGDNGRGFSQEYAAKIFEPFVRLVGQSHSQGSGIGLSICARIVEQHNGKIWAESKEGEGSTFYIELPA